MEYFPPALEKMVEQFARLPGIGRKTAQRLALFVLSLPENEVEIFAQSVLDAKRSIALCPVCQNLTEGDGLCPICASEKRDSSLVCVVADPRTSSPWNGPGNTRESTMCSTGCSRL